LLLLVKRLNYNRKRDNGIGLQMAALDFPISTATSGTPVGSGVYDTKLIDTFYQVTEDTNAKEVLCVKWTQTLLLGTTLAAAVVIRGKGLFELVDYRYASAFQGLYDSFVEQACNFIQVGRFHRFWLNCVGALRVMVVTPQTMCTHPEWSEIFTSGRAEMLNMRVLGRRIGYFINQIEDSNTLETVYAKKGVKKDKIAEVTSSTLLKVGSSGIVERFCGLHLYRCWFCKKPLLKPLQCGRCRSVVYCSKICQNADWVSHNIKCL